MSSIQSDDSTPSPPRRSIHVPNHGDMDFELEELERLRMSMGFTTVDELIAFMATGFVLGAFTDFINHHLVHAVAITGGNYPLPSLDQVITRIVDDTQFGTGFFTTANPDRSHWDANDHWARFVQQVYTAAQATNSPWHGTQEADFARIAWELYELLLFLARRWMDMQQ